MTLGIVLALSAALAYGAADFLGGLGSRRVGPWSVVLAGQLAGGTLMLVAGLVRPGSPVGSDFAWAVLAGLGTAVGTLCLYRGLARARMGLVAPISAVGTAILPVGVGVSLGERPTALVGLGVLVALPGIWLVSRETSGPGSSDRAGIIDGLGAGLGFGLLFVALGQVGSAAGTLPLAANQAIGVLVTMAAATVLKQPWLPGREAARWGTVSGVLGSVGTVAFLLAAQTSQLALAAVTASLFPGVTVVLAAVVLREPLGPSQRLGLATCLVATGLLALG